ncbi:response regulator transcription factor [Amycolatopsis balhimycina]|uniref:response regulator transcription factor n=1 Tax=Amycolatopsis balhimycina TaxID=208443 RepID=UPI000370F50C
MPDLDTGNACHRYYISVEFFRTVGLLHITAGTAKTHVAHLLLKLAARDRVQLVITAYQAGLVTP